MTKDYGGADGNADRQGLKMILLLAALLLLLASFSM